MSASLAVQRMVASALANIVGVTGVFDGPPPDAIPPYLVIGADIVTDWSTKTEVGHEHRLSISVWDAGPGAARAKVVMGNVESRLMGLAGSRDGHVIVSSRLVRTLVLTNAEGWSQGIIEFRLRSLAL